MNLNLPIRNGRPKEGEIEMENGIEIKWLHIVPMRTEHNEEYLVAIGTDNNVYEWNWETGKWVPYKKA